MAEELTIKQKKFLKYYLDTGNASEACRKAGYKCVASAQDNLEKPLIQQAFQELLDKAGLSDSKITQSLVEGLSATRIQNVNIILKKNSDGTLEAQDTDDFIEVPDYGVRHKYLETMIKLKQKFAPVDNLDSSKDTPLESVFIEFMRKHKQEIQSGEIEGVKITRREYKSLDQHLAR